MSFQGSLDRSIATAVTVETGLFGSNFSVADRIASTASRMGLSISPTRQPHCWAQSSPIA
jgi:hypothetical protein